MNKAATFVLFIATPAVGTIAGFFLTYGGTIMPGLGSTDDRSFVAAFQGLERTFGNFDTTVNWPVIVGFLGGPLFIIAAIASQRAILIQLMSLRFAKTSARTGGEPGTGFAVLLHPRPSHVWHGH